MDQRRISSPQQLSTAREGMVKSGKNQTLVPDASITFTSVSNLVDSVATGGYNTQFSVLFSLSVR